MFSPSCLIQYPTKMNSLLCIGDSIEDISFPQSELQFVFFQVYTQLH